MPSIIVNKSLRLDDKVEGMLFWEKDITFPKSLGNVVRIWKTLWQSTDRELPNNLLLALGACGEDAFPNIHRLLVIACTLPGFYLGYLRGRSFPHNMFSFRPKNIVIITVYK